VSIQKVIVGGAFMVFLGIGVAGLVKSRKIVKEAHEVAPFPIEVTAASEAGLEPEPAMSEEMLMREITPPEAPKILSNNSEIDRVRSFFSTGPDKLPIVETITYRSRVDWIQGRPAWIADYASHFKTSRHFIARSLNKKADYFTQKVSLGDRFNVIRTDKDVRFHLLVDLSKCALNFYYVDPDSGDYKILKTYPVAVGKRDENSPSGCTTPLGTYDLGEKVAIYKQGVEGFYLDEKIEMIQVFGTRWIPVEEGIGLHGVGWLPDPESGEYKEERENIGHYIGSGCIRMFHEDIEELFSIVISRPTTIEFVKEIALEEPVLEETGS
jgi:hypothetical protein